MFTILAQEGGGAPAQPGGDIVGLLVPFAAIFLIMYLLFIRPQRKQEAQRRAMIDAVKKNDKIMTSGGLQGVVTNVKDDVVTIRIDEARDVKVNIQKNFISAVLAKKEGAEEN